jgi:hypothetical protein
MTPIIPAYKLASGVTVSRHQARHRRSPMGKLSSRVEEEILERMWPDYHVADTARALGLWRKSGSWRWPDCCAVWNMKAAIDSKRREAEKDGGGAA